MIFLVPLVFKLLYTFCLCVSRFYLCEFKSSLHICHT